MKVDSLFQLQRCLQDPAGAMPILLAAGLYEISRTLQVVGRNRKLVGERLHGSLQTILKRGHLPDGSLFRGALLKGEGVCGFLLQDLRIEGGRHEQTGRWWIDHRHPLTREKESELYLFASPGAREKLGKEDNHYTPFETDLLFLRCQGLTLRSLSFQDPVKFAIGLGDGVRNVVLDQVEIQGGGEGGIWCGLALLDAPLPVPLPERVRQELPREILMDHCRVQGCGGPGVYLEAVSVVMEGCRLEGNHVDYPHNHDGGQLEIPYKSEDVLIRSCSILHAPALRRGNRILRSVGIEAFGRHIHLENMRIQGHSHEGILLNGASFVHLCGNRSVLSGNHTAVPHFPELSGEPQQNISVTTLAAQAALGAISSDITLDGICCENGVMFWSDGLVPDLRFHRIAIQNCDLRGDAGRGLQIGINNAGRSLQGTGWRIERNHSGPAREGPP